MKQPNKELRYSLVGLIPRKDVEPYLSPDVWLIDRVDGVVVEPERGSLVPRDVPPATETPDGQFKCLLDPDRFWIERIQVSRRTFAFLACLKEPSSEHSPIAGRARQLEKLAQLRWRSQVELAVTSAIQLCNSEKRIFEQACRGASELFGPGTSSHAYEAFAADREEAVAAPINLILGENELCAPAVHPGQPSHIGYVIAAGNRIYEPDVQRPINKDLRAYFVSVNDRTRSAATFFLPLGPDRRGAFQSVCNESDAFAEPERDSIAKILDFVVSRIQRLDKNTSVVGRVVKQWQDGIVTAAPQMERVLDLIRAVRDAPSSVHALITGESGTGKEVVARATHFGGPRAKGQFVGVDCSTLTETLLESELFGIGSGVATGVVARKGLIETAHGGTLFLDEIGNLSLTLQAKLLRVLQEREIWRGGSRQPIPVDFRLITATNKSLVEAIKTGTFRSDLYFRLRKVHIDLPPLRARTGDIEVLAEYFIELYSKEQGARIRSEVSPLVAERLLGHAWPGNVRELQNVIQTAVVLCKGDSIAPEDLDFGESLDRDVLSEDQAYGHLREYLDRCKGKYFRWVLAKANGNKTMAAEIAGIDRTTFHTYLRKFNLG